MKKIIYIIVLMLLIGLLLISNSFIIKEVIEDKKQEAVFDELNQITEVENITLSSEEEKRNLGQLYSLNNDLIGWIYIKYTNINYPVMQTKNNPNYYIRRDFYKNYSRYGTPYMAEQCNVETSSNIIIYGHNVKNSQMFGDLEKYKTKQFYNNHRIIGFETLDKKIEFEICFVIKTTAYSENSFKYYNYTDFYNEKEFAYFINQCKKYSIYETDIMPEYSNRLITLSTCEYSNENGRLAIIAREIK